MDGDDRRRQQYAAPYQLPNTTRASQATSMPPPPSAERFAQSAGQSPVRTDLPRAALSRPYLPGGYTGYGFQEQSYGGPAMHSSSPMQGVEMQYTAGYVQDPSRQPQLQQQSPSQPFAPYAQNVMLQSSPSQGMYEVPHFQQRQAAAVEVLSNQFGVPTQYLPSSEHSAVGVPAVQSQYVTSQAEQQAYGQQTPASRASISQGYAQTTADYPSYEQQEVQDTQEAEAAQSTLNEGIRQYQDQLKATFECIRTARVTEASGKIMDLTRWLLGSIVQLDLHHDKSEDHESRLDLWREFNLCWEALGQKQKDVTAEALRARRQPPDILTAETIHKMVDELISLCDQIEQHGLVDYDLGVWEEQIVNVFSECLDLLPSEESAAGQASSSGGGQTTT